MIFVTVVVPVLGVLIIIAALIAFRIQAVRAAREEHHWIEDESRLAKLASHRIDDGDDFAADIPEYTGEIPDDIPEFTPGHGAVAADPGWDASELLSSPAGSSPTGATSGGRAAGRVRGVPLAAPVAATPQAPLETETAKPRPLETPSPAPVETTATATGPFAGASGSFAGASGPAQATASGSGAREPHAPQSFGQYAAETPPHADDADDADPWTRLSFSRPMWPSGSTTDGGAPPDAGPGDRSGPSPLGGTTTSGRSVPAGSANNMNARRLPTVAELVHQIQTERHAPPPPSSGRRRPGGRDVLPSGATSPGRSWTQPQIRSEARQEDEPLPGGESGPQRPGRTDPLSGAGDPPPAAPVDEGGERPRRRAKHRRPDPVPAPGAGQDTTPRTPPGARSPKPSANRSDQLSGGAARPGGRPALPPRDNGLVDPSSRRPVRGHNGSQDGPMAPEPGVPAPRPPDEEASATGRLRRDQISGLAPAPGVRFPGRATDGEPLNRHEEGFKHRDVSRTGRPDHNDRPGDGVRRKPPVHRHPADGRWRP